MHRAIVTFSDPVEAHLAVTVKHRALMGTLPAFLRLLP